MILYHTTFPTPAGDFSAAIDDNGAVVATAFGGFAALRKRVRPASAEGVRWEANERRTADVRRQVREYFRGARHEFDLALAPLGTPFQRRVWEALRAIPFGAKASYGTLARTLRSSARAVGNANGANPVCLIVPCHRVIGTDGSLTGFAFGLGIKRQLLELEHARAGT